MTARLVCGVLVAAGLLATFGGAETARAGTLDDVRERGFVHCGASANLPGFSALNDEGHREGFETDFCRAMAAAIFGDAGAAKFTTLATHDAFATLANGEVDVLAGHSSWTLLGDTASGLDFIGVNFFDGQGFMVPTETGVRGVLDLDGATICVTQGTPAELNVAVFFGAHEMDYQALTFADTEAARMAYETGRCTAWTDDRSLLATRGLGLKDRGQHIILPEIISKEPIGPLVRQGDDAWKDLAAWTLNVMIAAEELGISQANVDEVRANSTSPEVQRLLGRSGQFGAKLGLGNDWAYNIVKQVGNFGESYERHLGMQTPLGLERGVNALWRDGGLIYSPPFR